MLKLTTKTCLGFIPWYPKYTALLKMNCSKHRLGFDMQLFEIAMLVLLQNKNNADYHSYIKKELLIT